MNPITVALPFIGAYALIPIVLYTLSLIAGWAIRHRTKISWGIGYLRAYNKLIPNCIKVKDSIFDDKQPGGVCEKSIMDFWFFNYTFLSGAVMLMISFAWWAVENQYEYFFTFVPITAICISSPFVVRYLCDIAYGIKYNKKTGDLERIDQLEKLVKELSQKNNAEPKKPTIDSVARKYGVDLEQAHRVFTFIHERRDIARNTGEIIDIPAEANSLFNIPEGFSDALMTLFED